MKSKNRSYSYHEVTFLNGERSHYISHYDVIEEYQDEYGDIVDTRLIKSYKTEEAAMKMTDRLNQATQVVGA